MSKTCIADKKIVHLSIAENTLCIGTPSFATIYNACRLQKVAKYPHVLCAYYSLDYSYVFFRERYYDIQNLFLFRLSGQNAEHKVEYLKRA